MRIAILILGFSAICLAQSPGEVVGTTYFDMQEMGSGTNRIVISSYGGASVCWMKATSDNYYPRFVYYNYRSPEGNWIGESQISPENGSGYGVIDTGPDDCIAIFYHTSGDGRISLTTTCHPIDYHVLPDTNLYWPKAAIAGDGRFHVISARYNNNNETTIMYNRSDDFGGTWPPWVRMDHLETSIWSLNSSESAPAETLNPTSTIQPGLGGVQLTVRLGTVPLVVGTAVVFRVESVS